MKIYSASYCDCVHESAYAPLSLHRTKKGAYKAMRKHKEEVYWKWWEMYNWKKDKSVPCCIMDDWRVDQNWAIEEMELLN